MLAFRRIKLPEFHCPSNQFLRYHLCDAERLCFLFRYPREKHFDYWSFAKSMASERPDYFHIMMDADSLSLPLGYGSNVNNLAVHSDSLEVSTEINMVVWDTRTCAEGLLVGPFLAYPKCVRIWHVVEKLVDQDSDAK